MKAAPCCIGQQVLIAKAPCSRATSLPSCGIGATSAFCEVIQISYRSEPRRSAASSKVSNLSHSSIFTAAGGRRTCYPTQKRRLSDPRNDISAGSVVRRESGSKIVGASASLAGRLIWQPMRSLYSPVEAAVSAALVKTQAARLPLQNYLGASEAATFSKHDSPRNKTS